MSKEQKLVNFWGKSSSEMWKHFDFETTTNELGVEKIIEIKLCVVSAAKNCRTLDQQPA